MAPARGIPGRGDGRPFLNGEINEDVYLLPPPDLQLQKSKVLKLKKALYGLCRAQYCWWVKLCRILQKLGWIQSDWDPCVFYKEDMILGFHVDDILITGDDKKLDEYFKTDMLRSTVQEPFSKTGIPSTYSVSVKVIGGGVSSQAEAIRHGISRALVKETAENRKDLKKVGLLKRDPRTKERRKFGLKKARKSAQWSKR